MRSSNSRRCGRARDVAPTADRWRSPARRASSALISCGQQRGDRRQRAAAPRSSAADRAATPDDDTSVPSIRRTRVERRRRTRRPRIVARDRCRSATIRADGSRAARSAIALATSHRRRDREQVDVGRQLRRVDLQSALGSAAAGAAERDANRRGRRAPRSPRAAPRNAASCAGCVDQDISRIVEASPMRDRGRAAAARATPSTSSWRWRAPAPPARPGCAARPVAAQPLARAPASAPRRRRRTRTATGNGRAAGAGRSTAAAPPASVSSMATPGQRRRSAGPAPAATRADGQENARADERPAGRAAIRHQRACGEIARSRRMRAVATGSVRSRSPESAQPEVVREVQPRRQAHARRIRIELPRDGRSSTAGHARRRSAARSPAAPARGELMRRPQPQPSGITWPNRSATSGGTSRIGPAAVCRTCGWRG